MIVLYLRDIVSGKVVNAYMFNDWMECKKLTKIKHISSKYHYVKEMYEPNLPMKLSNVQFWDLRRGTCPPLIPLISQNDEPIQIHHGKFIINFNKNKLNLCNEYNASENEDDENNRAKKILLGK